MMYRFFCLGISLAGLMMVGCTTPGSISSNEPAIKRVSNAQNRGNVQVVRTTAYSHKEADSLKYGKKTAAGTILKYGKVRSAAADWSEYPVGTVFRIEGEPYIYQIDDYGSALVGTQTIDMYKPSIRAMNDWGVRHVPIKILRWGSYAKSLEIMRPRTKYAHVRKMVEGIEARRGRHSS